LFVRDRANDRDHFFRLKKISPAHQPAGQAIFASIKNVIRIRKVWLNCIYNGSLYVPMGVFAGLWGVPFLIRLENLSLLEAASQVAYVFVGAAFGAPLFGILSNVLKSRLWVMRFCSLISLLFVLLIIYGDLIFPALSDSKLMISLCLFAYGLSTGGVIPSYAYATESVAKEHQGIAIGLTNMASLGIGACMMPAVGILLDLFWHGAVHHQHPVYSLQTYQYALVLLPISMLFACVSSFLLREKSS
jgi:sugar phosphate permease